MREQLGVAPALPVDSATKSYADAMSLLSAAPPVGWLMPDASCYNFSAGVALVSGKQTFHRLYLMPGTYDALYVNVTTPQSGGTTTLTGALYNDDGTNAWPDTSVAPFATAAFAALTSTGLKIATLAAPLVITKPTLLWVGVLYVAASAPSTAPILTVENGNLQTLARSTGIGFAPLRGYTRTGLSAPANTASTTSNMTASGSTDIIAVAIRRSA